VSRLKVTAVLAGAVLASTLALGCGSKEEDKQPKIQGTPDPRIKGPAKPGGGGQPGPAELK